MCSTVLQSLSDPVFSVVFLLLPSHRQSPVLPHPCSAPVLLLTVAAVLKDCFLFSFLNQVFPFDLKYAPPAHGSCLSDFSAYPFFL